MAQVDRISGLVGNLGAKAPCNCATTTAITLSGAQTIDGYACTSADNGGMGTRVLVKDQANPVDNGIYYCNDSAWQRAPDFDGDRDAAQGTLIYVYGGNVNINTQYAVATANPVNIGVSSLTFTLRTSASLVGFLQAGAGAVARTLQSKERDIINAADFGVVCDGVTNDTAATNLAITYANNLMGGQNPCIKFPPGNCLVTPGGLAPIQCDIDAPNTLFVASSNTLAPLLLIGAPLSINILAAHAQHIRILGLLGYGWTPSIAFTGPRYGYGVGFSAVANSYFGMIEFHADFIEGFLRGISADEGAGQALNTHIGEAVFDVQTISFNDIGIYLAAGNLQNENNYFDVTYMTGNNVNIACASVGASFVCQNVFHIGVLELQNIAGTRGISLTGNSFQNRFTVDDIYYSANTQYIVVTDGTPHDNIYDLPDFDLTKVVCTGDVLINGIGMLSGPAPARSKVYGASPSPASGSWRTGDRYIVNNPVVGGASSFVRLAGPVWGIEASARPIGWTTYTPVVTSTGGALTSYTVNAAKYIPFPDYVLILLDVTITNNGTGTGGIQITLPINSVTNGSVLSGKELVNTGVSLIGLCSGASVIAVDYKNAYPVAANSRVVLTGMYATS